MSFFEFCIESFIGIFLFLFLILLGFSYLIALLIVYITVFVKEMIRVFIKKDKFSFLRVIVAILIPTLTSILWRLFYA